VARKEVVREVRDNVKEPQHDAAIDDIKINVRASAKLTRMVTGSRRSSIDDDDDEVRTPGNRNHLVRVWEALPRLDLDVSAGWARPPSRGLEGEARYPLPPPNRRVRRRRRGSSLCC
jgi:hypothetical protein